MIAIDKPSGLLSVPGIGPEKQDCAVARVQGEFPAARIVHRLDRDTSGVMVLALDADTHRELSRQFQDRETEKRYSAIVAGHVAEDEGEVDLPMRKDMTVAGKPRHIIDHEQGRQALTRWTVIERMTLAELEPLSRPSSPPHGPEPKAQGTSITRLSLRPVTGRSHQLRVHMVAIGHAILGDDLYAPPDVVAMADRLLLHAEYLMVTDPYTAAPRRFESPCPF